jgi:hypothetical protein
LTSWSKENDNGGKKVMTRGRRSKNKRRAEKTLEAKSGVEISEGTHTATCINDRFCFLLTKEKRKTTRI